MNTIYFNNQKLLLVSSAERFQLKTTGKEEIFNGKELDKDKIQQVCEELFSSERDTVFVSDDVDGLLDRVKKQFIVIQAGGGFVYTAEKQVLLIFRRGKWDLPKGKLDEGESLEECAVREVKEETGISNIQLGSSLLITYHTYKEKGKVILKESHWYLMKAEAQQLHPQTEEDISECKWVDFAELTGYMQNTHASIKDVVEAAQRHLSANFI